MSPIFVPAAFPVIPSAGLLRNVSAHGLGPAGRENVATFAPLYSSSPSPVVILSEAKDPAPAKASSGILRFAQDDYEKAMRTSRPLESPS
jgi:hypothetical protein